MLQCPRQRKWLKNCDAVNDAKQALLVIHQEAQATEKLASTNAEEHKGLSSKATSDFMEAGAQESVTKLCGLVEKTDFLEESRKAQVESSKARQLPSRLMQKLLKFWKAWQT